MERIRTIVFDYDGTLHDALAIYAPAFHLAYDYLIALGYIPEGSLISDQEIGSWLGYSSVETWERFMPSLPISVSTVCSAMISEAMIAYIQSGKARLYEGSLKVLSALKEAGFELVFLSNCRRAYMEAHQKLFKLENYFSGFYCGEDYGFAPKHEIFKEIKAMYPGGFAIVGDRFHDMEAASRYKVMGIGCSYGYGAIEELKEAKAIVKDINEVEALFVG